VPFRALYPIQNYGFLADLVTAGYSVTDETDNRDQTSAIRSKFYIVIISSKNHTKPEFSVFQLLISKKKVFGF
jgi:hypothetical protein